MFRPMNQLTAGQAQSAKCLGCPQQCGRQLGELPKPAGVTQDWRFWLLVSVAAFVAGMMLKTGQKARRRKAIMKRLMDG